MRPLAAAIVLLGLLAAACGGGNAPSAGPTPSAGSPTATASPAPSAAFGRIAFVSKSAAGQGIFIADADGRGLMALELPGSASFPAWSPDGSRLAFYMVQDGDNALYVAHADGSGLARLTSVPTQEYLVPPIWSPDASRIAFEFNREPGDLGGDTDIYVVNANGSGLSNLTNNPAADGGPSWSPDGARIVFDSDRDGNSEVYLMNADGSAQTRLTGNRAVDTAPSWSPDGEHITFVSNRDGNYEIYAMTPDGSNQTNLTNNPAGDFSSPVGHFPPAWSPDGKRIAFVSDRDGNLEIYTVDVDASVLTRITNYLLDDTFPTWSPDGAHIAFQRDADGLQVYVARSDGSSPTRITSPGGAFPVWSPAR